jgi:hypothetical protein
MSESQRKLVISENDLKSNKDSLLVTLRSVPIYRDFVALANVFAGTLYFYDLYTDTCWVECRCCGRLLRKPGAAIVNLVPATENTPRDVNCLNEKRILIGKEEISVQSVFGILEEEWKNKEYQLKPLI